MKKCLLLLLLASSIHAETTKTVFNPFTGKLDFITTLSSTTLPAGSTFYIQDNGVGGLFEVNTSSPGINITGQLSTSKVDSVVSVWLWANGHRWRFAPTLDDPAAAGGSSGQCMGLLCGLTYP